MSDIGTRGKWAEGEVRKWLKKRADSDVNFDFYRFPDARAGSFTTVPADFEACHFGHNHLLEVKEIKVTTAKSRRVPYKNFSPDKVARMVKRQMAGATCNVLVCFMPLKEWRLVPLSFFQHRPGGTSGSWEVSEFPVTVLAAAMFSIFERDA